MIKAIRQNFIDFFKTPAVLVSMIPLIVISTTRLAYALVCALGIVWVYGVSAITLRCAGRLFPQKNWKKILIVFLFSFTGSLFFLMVELCNPLLATEIMLALFLIPVLCCVSKTGGFDKEENCGTAVSVNLCEALLTGIVLILLSIIREPLGHGTLSLPGGIDGIYEILDITDIMAGAFFLPIRIIASSSGALLLLGCFLLALRFIKPAKKKEEEAL